MVEQRTQRICDEASSALLTPRRITSSEGEREGLASSRRVGGEGAF
jgi:hypothetical protein